MTPEQARDYLRRGGAREHQKSTPARRVFWLSRVRRWALVVEGGLAGSVELTLHSDCPCGGT